MTKLIHTPFGIEHPYEQLPEERFPRQPLAGQRFEAGFVSRPPGIVEELTVYAQVGDAPPRQSEAHLVPNWQPQLEAGVGAEFLERRVQYEQDVWSAALVAPPLGETLTYWATCPGAESARFSLRGEAWVKEGGCTIGGDGRMVVSRVALGCRQMPGVPVLHNVEWLSDGQTCRRVRLTFAASADERFFGLGERFNALDQRGNMLDIRCYEQYKNQGRRTYLPIPFLLSSQGFGVWVESSRWMQFDLAATHSDQWSVEADVGPDATICLRWFEGDDPYDIVAQFTQLTGPATLPPSWAFGLWMSGNEWNSQARIQEEVESSLAHGISPSVIVIEAWSDEATFYVWNDATYASRPGATAFRYQDFTFPVDGKWPDPKAMVEWLHAHNIRVLLWQIPVLKASDGANAQHDNDRAHFLQCGFAVADADGSPHQIRPFWFRGGEIWDVTNAAARKWWLDKRAYLIEDLGIDGFKTDGGEHLWGAQTQFADGRRGDELWNEYPKLYAEAYFELANRGRLPSKEGACQALTFSRSGFAGSQQTPAHWAGDENSTWAAYRHSILAGLAAGVSGILFWGWDYGGFSGEIPSAELYLRAMAMATFCPIMQYHAEYNAHRTPKRDRTPWNIQARTGDERVVPTARHFTNLRYNLLPYIWQEAQYAAQTGQPMMRSVQIYDAAAGRYDYFFGRDLLVSPVVAPEIMHTSLSLPAGDWYDFWNGRVYAGKRRIQVETPINRIPLFVRAGADIPVNLGPTMVLGQATETRPELAVMANHHLVFAS